MFVKTLLPSMEKFLLCGENSEDISRLTDEELKAIGRSISLG